jgi:uncharacterized protein (TIGR03435 family)
MIGTLTTLTLSFSAAVYAQQFEVASIKPTNSASNSFSSGLNTSNGRLTAINVTLKRCIMGAYGLGPNQIFGGPDWLDTDRFDIAAKADQPVGDRIQMTMMQTLLAERFKLQLHRETKPVQTYVLEVAKNGPKLERGDGHGSKTDNGRGDLVIINASMDRFAEILSRQMDLPVVNHTGIDGVFNLKLKWTPESTKAVKPEDGSVVEGPSIFTAIQEQLGLRLHAQKIPIEVLVIDHAEKPSEN